MLTDQQIIDGNWYICESPTTSTFLVPLKKRLIHGVFWCFTSHISGSSKITGRSGQKDSVTKHAYSNVLPRIFRPLSPVVKPFGFLLWLEVTHSELSARKLPDLKRSILMCGCSRKFIINLPSEMWKVSEVHHGALRKKPLSIIFSYFPPNHTSEHLSKPPLNWRPHIKICNIYIYDICK